MNKTFAPPPLERQRLKRMRPFLFHENKQNMTFEPDPPPPPPKTFFPLSP